MSGDIWLLVLPSELVLWVGISFVTVLDSLFEILCLILMSLLYISLLNVIRSLRGCLSEQVTRSTVT